MRPAPSLFTLVLGIAGTLGAQSRPSPVTFADHVAPIVFKKCASCHRPGEAGPFPLLSFEDVRKRAKMVRAVTESRLMPPWHPDPDCGPFLEENRLSNEEIATIGQWVDGGLVEG